MNTTVFNCMDTHFGNGLFYFNELLICSFIACTFKKNINNDIATVNGVFVKTKP